ncbi:alpha/beta fold hydrolase [Mycetocola saprophilus]|uniref:alpha/beta fold hydrolase n=1 Tax=Mycetocola saprophilus TaxID=76636 RepID=UPI003BF12E20
MLIPTEPTVPTEYVTTADGLRLATYRYGDPSAPTVLAVHGFASHAFLNWELSGWTRELTRAGFGVLAFDLRGHGSSDAPSDPARYSLSLFASDARAVLAHHGVPRAHYLGYSMGARTGWRLGRESPELLYDLVLGGMPEGDPLTTFDAPAAYAYRDHGTPIADPLTAGYVRMAEGVPGNRLDALIAVVEGVRGGEHAALGAAPTPPMLLATGEKDAVAPGSRALAAEAGAEFVEIPGRGHLNAVGARAFKDAAVEFLVRHRDRV